MGMGMVIQREADFMIHGIVKYSIGGHEVWITTTTVGMVIVSLIILALAFMAKRTMENATDVPGTFQNILELGVEMLEKMTQGILGGNAGKFAADYGVTFLLGMVTFAIVQYQGVKNRKLRHFTSLFEPVPLLFPINLIGEVANPISISLRLFANLLSGVIIMGLWYGMLPIFVNIGIPAALHVYCDLFSGAIQTYVFCMLTMVYINDKME